MVTTARPRIFQPSKGVFLLLVNRLSLLTTHSCVGIDDDDVGRDADLERPAGNPEDPCRLGGNLRDRGRQVDQPVVHQLQGQRQQGLEADHAARG